MKKRLQKSNKQKMIGGVCGGIAEYFNIDPTIVRILAVIFGMINGIGILAYIICCIVMPKADGTADYSEDEIDNMKSANINEEKKSEGNTSGEKGSGHSDSDFDEYFKK